MIGSILGTKLRSRKLWATVVGGLIIAGNDALGLGLDDAAMQNLTLLIVGYLVAQGWVDGRAPAEQQAPVPSEVLEKASESIEDALKAVRGAMGGRQ